MLLFLRFVFGGGRGDELHEAGLGCGARTQRAFDIALLQRRCFHVEADCLNDLRDLGKCGEMTSELNIHQHMVIYFQTEGFGSVL